MESTQPQARKLSGFARNVFFKGIGEILIRLLSFAFTVLVARSLGENDFGVLNFANSFAILFLVIVDFGLNPLLMRDVARTPERTAHFFFNLLMIKTGLAVVFLATVWLVLKMTNLPPAMQQITQWFVFFLVFNSFVEFINAVFSAHQKMQFEAFANSTQKILLLVFGGLAVMLGWGLMGVTLAYVLAGMCGMLLGFWLLQQQGFLKGAWQWDPQLMKHAFIQALPLTVNTLFINIYFRIDMTMLAKWRPVAEVGYYSAAHKCVEVLMAIPAIVVLSAFPRFSQLFQEDSAKLNLAAHRVLKLLIFLAVPMVIGTSVISTPLMTLLFGKAFAASGPALSLLTVALGFIFVNYLLAYLLITANRQVMNAWISGSAVLVSVVSNLLLIPKYGYLGAAAAAVITEGVLFTGYFLVVRRQLFKLKMWPLLLRTGAAGIIMFLPVYGLRHFHPVLPLVTGVITYLVAAVAVKAVSPDDLRLIWKVHPGGKA